MLKTADYSGFIIFGELSKSGIDIIECALEPVKGTRFSVFQSTVEEAPEMKRGDEIIGTPDRPVGIGTIKFPAKPGNVTVPALQ